MNNYRVVIIGALLDAVQKTGMSADMRDLSKGNGDAWALEAESPEWSALFLVSRSALFTTLCGWVKGVKDDSGKAFAAFIPEADYPTWVERFQAVQAGAKR